MRVLRATDHKVMPWKNGGGTTTEIAVSPADAGLEDFDWRISMARVEADGPFSAFPDIDRTLAVLDGKELALDIEGREGVVLTQSSQPYAFPADLPTHGRLANGPITDLNIMVRRGRCEASVIPISLERPLELNTGAGATLIFVKSGSVLIGDRETTLSKLDVARLDAGEAALLTPNSTAAVFLIELRQA